MHKSFQQPIYGFLKLQLIHKSAAESFCKIGIHEEEDGALVEGNQPGDVVKDIKRFSPYHRATFRPTSRR
jgi:hypothetical protein